MATSALEAVYEYVAYLSPQKRTMRFSFLPAIALAAAGSFLLFSSCAASRHAERRFAKKIQKEVEKSPVFSRAFTGFTLLDPETGKTLADVNGDKFFTPASNTKILTLATCLEVLGDSVPGIEYQIQNGYLYFRGVADPTFLHAKFQNWQPAFELLQNAGDTSFFVLRDFFAKRFGSGWAWDDYDYYFQTERSQMPTYGNTLTVKAGSNNTFRVYPAYFTDYCYVTNSADTGRAYINRAEFEHSWDVNLNSETDSLVSPMPTYSTPFIEDTLHKTVVFKMSSGIPFLNPSWRTLYSTPLDTVLRRMMHQSDNFIAEQMLLVCAGQKFDILQQDTMIKWMLDSILTSLPQRPRWVDGSGLSRYNLITPRDLGQVLLKLWKEQPQEFLLSLFPAGGMNGTVANWYKGKDGKPYVFAKTGSMSGVHCLSGYVVTKRGKTLIFSFMHNNFVDSNKPWKEEMQRILERIASGVY